MKKSHAIAALLATSLLLSACGKTEQAPESEQAETNSEQQEAPVTAEQAAAIAALDQPNFENEEHEHADGQHAEGHEHESGAEHDHEHTDSTSN